ncbi:MAG: hypothetical protein ACFFG0_43340 [Candidatus Thorarchaeota archaeon]
MRLKLKPCAFTEATIGSTLSPMVDLLRNIRDNKFSNLIASFGWNFRIQCFPCFGYDRDRRDINLEEAQEIIY